MFRLIASLTTIFRFVRSYITQAHKYLIVSNIKLIARGRKMKKLLLAVSCIAISFGVNASIINSVSIESVRVNITDINVAIEAGQEKIH